MLQLTEYADKLLTAGYPNAYDATRESINQHRAVRLLQQCNYQLTSSTVHTSYQQSISIYVVYSYSNQLL